jgi:bifunctional non-homologous end joining protein LigD
MRPLRSGAKAKCRWFSFTPASTIPKFGTCPRCVRVPCRPASSRRACPRRPHDRRPARCGCMKSSMTAFGLLPARTARGYSRPGNDLTRQFPLIAETLARLRSRSCIIIIDGETVACDEKTGIACFDRLRHHRVDETVFLYAFDLIELGGDDLRREPLEVRKATLASVLAKAGPGIRFNEHLDYDDGAAVFQHPCKMVLEGIVSKRKDPLYRSGRSPDGLKMKNPACAAREWARP